MAVPVPKPSKKTDLPVKQGKKKGLSLPELKLTPIQVMAAGLLGRGYTNAQVAERMVDYIITKSHRNRQTRVKMARTRIRQWNRTQQFRDAVYDTALIKLDLDSPLILQGVSRKARAGRVDAARLALELTGRHDPKGEQGVSHVEVSFNGIPRPERDHRSRDTDDLNEAVDAEWEEIEE